MSAVPGSRVGSLRVAGVPAEVVAAIAAAWLLAAGAEATGAAGRLHHDGLIEGGAGFGVALGLSTLGWVVMVAAMMLPSSLPLVRLYGQATAAQERPAAAMRAFLAGYALVWTAFGALALVGDFALHALIGAVPLLHANDWAIGGSVLALAGAFQFTPLKDACLEQCRHPGAFLLRYYERGVGGGFRLGLRHGAFCVGCCWALMLVMFAVGVLSLLWMGALTALMVHEKTRPAGRRAVPVTGVALLAAASIALLWGAYAAGVLQ